MACHDRYESSRIRWRAIAPPGDVEVRTKQHIVSLVNFTRMRDAAQVEDLEGTSDRMKSFLQLLDSFGLWRAGNQHIAVVKMVLHRGSVFQP
jgi:hypothetical protein